MVGKKLGVRNRVSAWLERTGSRVWKTNPEGDPKSAPSVVCPISSSDQPTVLKACTLPLTGKGVVDRIITNLGVLDVVPGGLKLVELADSVSEAELRAATAATIFG